MRKGWGDMDDINKLKQQQQQKQNKNHVENWAIFNQVYNITHIKMKSWVNGECDANHVSENETNCSKNF